MKSKKVIAAIAAAAVLAGAGTVAFVPEIFHKEEKTNSVAAISVNPSVRYQKLEGWGTSLAWFANIIGNWTEDYNGNGKADREDIAELMYSPEYLNLNIVRYNIGGGDDPAHDHIKRCEARVPGWKISPEAKLDPTADAGQIWFLEKANEMRDDVVNEVFSNTPPYYMTFSGCASGSMDAYDNLRGDQYDDFAEYLAEVTQWLDRDLYEKYGNHIDYIEPVNEPSTNYWKAYSSKQEGCHFSPGEKQSRIYRETQKALANLNLDYIQITGTDETSVDSAIRAFNSLDDDIKRSMPLISTHTYNGDRRRNLSDLAASYDKGLWMSEVCFGGGPHDPESMERTSSLAFAESIKDDLKTLQSTAWIDWQVVDSEYELLKWNQNWGLIHAVYEADDQPVPGYHDNLLDKNGKKKSGIPGTGCWHIGKQFYTLMQYSKYLKKDYTMIEIGDESMAAAISPEGDELVIVAENSGKDRKDYLNLSCFPGAVQAKVYRTSDKENCELIKTIQLSENIMPVKLDAGSVTTYVITGKDGTALFNTKDGIIKRVNSGVLTDESTVAMGAGTNNKFEYSGSWKEQAGQAENYQKSVQRTTTPGDKLTFRFDGERAVITGNLGEDGGKFTYTVDGGAPKEGDTYAEDPACGVVLADTGYLPKGSHTIVMKMKEGSTGDSQKPSITIDEARVYYGKVSEDF